MDTGWRCSYPAQAVGAKVELISSDHLDLIVYPHMRGAMPWRQVVTYHDGHEVVLRTQRRWLEWRNLNPNWQHDVALVTAEFPKHEGAAVWIRPDLARATLAKAMREQQGIRTIAEVDDNYLSNATLNLALRTAGVNEQWRLDHLKAMASNDAIVFSTEWLRDYYAKKIKQAFGKVPGLELFVCRNNVPAHLWPERIERDGPLRVGWMGSPSHVWDIDIAYWALLDARESGAEVHLIGYNPVDDPLGKGSSMIVTEEENQQRSEKSLFKINQWRKVRFKHTPWADPTEYLRRALPLDIGLCPLLTNENTLGKSDIKAVEYTISGAAVIAQNNAVYNRTWKHGETALLAGSPWEFRECVRTLMRDHKLRAELVANAQQYVRENRADKQLREEWGAAIAGS